MSITLLALAAAASANPDAVVGRWKTETKNAIVEIERCGKSLCGKLVTSDGIAANPGLKDSENKDPKLRNRPLKGLPLLWGFTYKDGAWVDGNIYKVDEGKTYASSITPVDANTLTLKGCVWIICKSQTWRRVG